MNIVYSTLYFLLALTILITVHEWGHFIVARMVGVKVLRFSIGFGKTIFTYKGKKGTEYVLGMVPLGGYIKMLDEDETEVDNVDLDKVVAFEHALIDFMNSEYKAIIEKINVKGDFNDDIAAELSKGIEAFKSTQTW